MSSITFQTASPRTHYEILNIPSTAPLDAPILRRAYKRALLLWHPDKQDPSSLQNKSKEQTSPSVDDIALAYAVLADPEKRTKYNRQLALACQRKHHGLRKDEQGEQVDEGVTFARVDLDDMAEGSDGERGFWTYVCRCGAERAYLLGEERLEEEAETGAREVWVPCEGCSLWLVVEFGLEGG